MYDTFLICTLYALIWFILTTSGVNAALNTMPNHFSQKYIFIFPTYYDYERFTGLGVKEITQKLIK